MGQLTYSDRASELFKPPCRDNLDSKASRSSRAGKALEVHVQNDKTAALPERNAAVISFFQESPYLEDVAGVEHGVARPATIGL